ncbi:MAG: hypothetical protein ACPKQO_00440 [Nitrososphaeraceae archaeon]
MKNNFTLIWLLTTLSILTVASTLNLVNAQENQTNSEEPKFYSIQRILPYIDLFIDEEIKTTNMAASSNQTSDHVPKIFAIQHATSGSLSEINETAYLLELNDVSDKTILFSDRPGRIVTSISTSDFIGNWSVGENSFAVDAPNAILVADEKEEKQDFAIVELFNPIYESDKNASTYNMTPVNSTSL